MGEHSLALPCVFSALAVRPTTPYNSIRSGTGHKIRHSHFLRLRIEGGENPLGTRGTGLEIALTASNTLTHLPIQQGVPAGRIGTPTPTTMYETLFPDHRVF